MSYHSQSGLTLFEVTLALSILAVMGMALLQSMHAQAHRNHRTVEELVALELAHSLAAQKRLRGTAMPDKGQWGSLSWTIREEKTEITGSVSGAEIITFGDVSTVTISVESSSGTPRANLSMLWRGQEENP